MKRKKIKKQDQEQNFRQCDLNTTQTMLNEIKIILTF